MYFIYNFLQCPNYKQGYNIYMTRGPVHGFCALMGVCGLWGSAHNGSAAHPSQLSSAPTVEAH